MNEQKIQIGISEVLQFAIKIEENGWDFYKKFSDLVGNEEVKKLFVMLADDELDHKKIFEEMLQKIEKYEPKGVYPPEYFAYLRAYADNIVFKKGLEEELKKEMDVPSILDFGMKIELDSINYYQETKNFVPTNQKNIIDKIIGEERKHFLKLSDLKNSL